jgi:beta-lactamase class A
MSFPPARRPTSVGGLIRALLLCALAYAPLSAQQAPLERLESEIARLAEIAGGTVGLAAIHLESGREVYLNGDEPFPMASSYKVPIAARIFDQVDRGEVRLDSLITLRPGDLHPGSGTLTSLFNHPGVTVPLVNLVELMLLISDNSATDLVLEAAGGAGAVTEHMHGLGLHGIRVDRPTVRLIADWIGITDLPSDDVDPETFGELSRAVSADARAAAARAFDVDPKDTATPRDMARLLAMIQRHEILTPERSDQLLDIMARSTTGQDRIKGLLPPGIEVAHKTGTIGGTTNDVGVIELPYGGGHVAVVLFVKASERDVPTRERAIAQIARSIYDFFLFNAL